MQTQNQSSKNTDPINKKEEVPKSKDKHIDQDFEGFPHHPAKENIIRPKTEEEMEIADSGDEDEFAHVNPSLLSQRGYTAVDIENIMHGNWLRFLRNAWK